MTDLYRVIDRNTGNVVADGFAKREDAKPARDKANAGKADAVVCRGNDHPRGATVGEIKVKQFKAKKSR